MCRGGGGYPDSWKSGFWAANLAEGKYQSSTKPGKGTNVIYNLSYGPVFGLRGVTEARVGGDLY